MPRKICHRYPDEAFSLDKLNVIEEERNLQIKDILICIRGICRLDAASIQIGQ